MHQHNMEEYSPISGKHQKENLRDTSLSVHSWENILHSSITSPKYASQQSQINLLIAKNKMARTLDSIFSRRIRWSYQSIKQVLYDSQLSISYTSSYKNQSSISNKSIRNHKTKYWNINNLKAGLQTLQGVVKNIHQKTKVQSFTFMKINAEDPQDLFYTRSQSADTNWLHKQQFKECLSTLEKIFSKRRHQHFQTLKQNSFLSKRNRVSKKIIEVHKSNYNDYQYKMATPFKKKDFNLQSYSRQRVKNQKPLFSQLQSNQPQRSQAPVVQKIVKSQNKYKSNSKYSTKQILTERSYGNFSQRKSHAEIEYIRSQSKNKMSKNRISCKKQLDCMCGDQNNFYTSRKTDNCKYCKLFMDDFEKTSRPRKNKYTFFSK